MALLSIKERQIYLKELGFYKGNVDGIEGKLTKKAYTNLQNKYFSRKKDRDGIYGNNTDILLKSAWNCRDLKHFKLTEFKCTCKCKYCTGYPAVLDRDLLLYVDDLRKHYRKSIHIESGLRCKKRNSELPGSSKTSRHMVGKALDLKQNTLMKTLGLRIEFIDYYINNYPNARYGYCNGYENNKGKKSYKAHSGMGNNIHIDVV